MPDGSDSPLILILFFLCLSAFLSMAETALMSVNKVKINVMAESGLKKAVLVEKITKDNNKLLRTLLIGHDLINVAICSLFTIFFIKFMNSKTEVMPLFIIILFFSILIFVEIIPKACALINPEKVSFFVSVPIQFIIIALTPIIFVSTVTTGFIVKLFGGDKSKAAPIITEIELKQMVSVSHEEGVIEESEKQMINNVFDFEDNSATDVMTHRTEIISLPIDASHQAVLELFKNEQYSRIPVYKEDIDHIVGILHFKDFIFSNMSAENFQIEKLLRPPFFSYETKSTSKLFSEMRTSGITMAIILDEYGGTLGLVSVHDLVEEIVGDIIDEFDNEEDKEITPLGDNIYIVAGGAKIDDFNEIAGTCLRSDEYDSIAGYVIELLGAIPNVGSEIKSVDENIHFAIVEMDRNRITKIKITIACNN